jgi:hypothetical protein
MHPTLDGLMPIASAIDARLLSLGVPVVDDGPEPRAIRTAEVKANVIPSHGHGTPDLRRDRNHLLNVEH